MHFTALCLKIELKEQADRFWCTQLCNSFEHSQFFCLSFVTLQWAFPGFKETAFLYAISSAGLTHAMAKACSAGRMERCTCDEAPDLENRKAWQWGGCGDNLKYANKFVKDFLGKRSNKDLRARVDMHNTNVGMKVCVQDQKMMMIVL